MRSALVSILVASFVTLVACGGDVGDSCDDEGKVGGECDDGNVCGKAKEDGSGGLVCLKQCNSAADCGSGEDCSGVGKTSLKGCRAR